MADFKRDLLLYGGINAMTRNMALKGNIRMFGNGSYIRQATIGDLVIVGNAVIPGGDVIPSIASVDIRGNVFGTYDVVNVIAIRGNIGNTTFSEGNVVVNGQLDAFENITAKYFRGNGSQLTGVMTTLPSITPIDIVGNISAPSNITATGHVTIVGNVTANYFQGNGSQLTDVTTTLPSITNMDIVGNVSAPGNIIAMGQVTVVGNVSAVYFKGNGSQLLTNVITLPPVSPIDITGNVNCTNVYYHPMPFVWSAPINEDPATGFDLTVPGKYIQGNNIPKPSYVNTEYGVKLTSTMMNQLNAISWIVPDFDFMRDFTFEVSMYMDNDSPTQPRGDGIFFGFGATNLDFTGFPNLRGAVSFNYNTCTKLNTSTYIDHQQVGMPVSFHPGVVYQGKFFTAKVCVRRVGSRRFAFWYTGDGGCLENAVNITSWVPKGTQIYVGGRTGDFVSNQYVNYVALYYN